MCSGKSQKRQAAQQQQMQQQQQVEQTRQFEAQMAMQQEQMARQDAQYREQLAIATAPPPPAPNKVTDAPAAALEMSTAENPAMARQGAGRRRMRTDLAMAGGYGGLSIPAT
jgi:hypothetical protein